MSIDAACILSLKIKTFLWFVLTLMLLPHTNINKRGFALMQIRLINYAIKEYPVLWYTKHCEYLIINSLKNRNRIKYKNKKHEKSDTNFNWFHTFKYCL